MFLLVPAYLGCPGPKAVKRLCVCVCSFSALMLLAGRQEGHPACKKTEWCGAGVLICLERGADLHMAQLKPLPLTVSCFSKIEVGLVPAHLGSHGKIAAKRVCVRACVRVYAVIHALSHKMTCAISYM